MSDKKNRSATATGPTPAGFLVGLTSISAALDGRGPKLALRLIRRGLPARRLSGSAGPYIVHCDTLKKWIETYDLGAPL